MLSKFAAGLFLSTPSARRATVHPQQPLWVREISIHALREEGDLTARLLSPCWKISIHALREEGDQLWGQRWCCLGISIHALREEGDLNVLPEFKADAVFLSTPSARRATWEDVDDYGIYDISIHALREEGDSKNRDKISIFKQIIQHSARI